MKVGEIVDVETYGRVPCEPIAVAVTVRNEGATTIPAIVLEVDAEFSSFALRPIQAVRLARMLVVATRLHEPPFAVPELDRAIAACDAAIEALAKGVAL